MKFKILTAFIFLINTVVMAQNNPKAEAILKKVSEKLVEQQNIKIEFTHSLENKTVNIKQTSKGHAILQGEKYVLHYLDNIILFDEKNSYIISPENEEVNITSVNDMDDESLTPSKMLSFYKKGYIYQLEKKTNSTQFIKLIPTQESEEIDHIILGVDTTKHQIVSLKEVGKNNTNTSFKITNYVTNQDLEPTTFTFDKAKYEALDYYINE